MIAYITSCRMVCGFVGCILFSEAGIAAYTPPTNTPDFATCQGDCDVSESSCVAWCYYNATPRQCTHWGQPSECGKLGPDCCNCMTYCDNYCSTHTANCD